MKAESWKDMLIKCMSYNGETWEDVIDCTLSEELLNQKFDSGHGGTEGEPFTLWTNKRVYFPVCYDGAEWVGSVSRNPDGAPTSHVGGG